VLVEGGTADGAELDDVGVSVVVDSKGAAVGITVGE
jgi:hypothetical protein